MKDFLCIYDVILSNLLIDLKDTKDVIEIDFNVQTKAVIFDNGHNSSSNNNRQDTNP